MKNIVNLIGAGILVYLLFGNKGSDDGSAPRTVPVKSDDEVKNNSLSNFFPVPVSRNVKQVNNESSPLLSTYEASYEDQLLYVSGTRDSSSGNGSIPKGL